jgi:hypothetical protein
MITALVVIGFGLLIDMLNLYWDFKSIRSKVPSGIILVPLIPYLTGVLLLKYSGTGWGPVILLFVALFCAHVFSVFLLPFLIMMVLNAKHGRNILNLKPYDKEKRLTGNNGGHR